MKVLSVIWKTIKVLLLLIIGCVLIGFLVAPIYKFPEPKPFGGDKIYDPYKGIDSTTVWRKANFHAHSKLKFFTNGAKPIEEVVDDYRSYGYDIIGISNYQTISRYEPQRRSEHHIPVYEHGYNVFKFHQLIFGAESHSYRDILLPVTLCQKQYLLTTLGEKADILCVNHPAFTLMFKPEDMRSLSGYRLIEGESGMAKSAAFWDEGLSSGHPSFNLSGDDSHNTDRPHDIATDCNFIPAASCRYEDIIDRLEAGRYYSMKIPNFGDGDTTVKRAKNLDLPRLTSVSFNKDTIRVGFSRPATVTFIGQGGIQKAEIHAKDTTAAYGFTKEDTYIRVDAVFEDGVHIFLNPWFRYEGDDPFAVAAPVKNKVATITKDVVLGIVLLMILVGIVRIIFRKDKRRRRNNYYGKDQRYVSYR